MLDNPPWHNVAIYPSPEVFNLNCFMLLKIPDIVPAMDEHGYLVHVEVDYSKWATLVSCALLKVEFLKQSRPSPWKLSKTIQMLHPTEIEGD